MDICPHSSTPSVAGGVARTGSDVLDFAFCFCVTLRSLLSGTPPATPTTRVASTTLKECHEGTYACIPLTLICSDCVTVDGLDEVLPGRDGRDSVEQEPGAGHFAWRVRVVGQSGSAVEIDSDVPERAAVCSNCFPDGRRPSGSDLPVFPGLGYMASHTIDALEG